MKTFVLAAVATLVLSVGVANARSQPYSAPAHNYYQNNWSSQY